MEDEKDVSIEDNDIKGKKNIKNNNKEKEVEENNNIKYNNIKAEDRF